jgi:hypothetical protein
MQRTSVMLEIPEKSVLRIGEIAWSCNVWATYRTMVTVRFAERIGINQNYSLERGKGGDWVGDPA